MSDIKMSNFRTIDQLSEEEINKKPEIVYHPYPDPIPWYKTSWTDFKEMLYGILTLLAIIGIIILIVTGSVATWIAMFLAETWIANLILSLLN